MVFEILTMERYKRPILYDPSKSVEEQIQQRRNPEIKKVIVETPCEWIKRHPLFSIAGMAKQVGIDPSNLHKQIKMGVLPKSKENDIIQILKQYGYGI